MTLREYATDWLALRPNLRPRTHETYQGHLRVHVFPQLGETPLAQLTPTSVRAWHAQLHGSLCSNSVAKCYRLLRTILETAVIDELIDAERIRRVCFDA